MIREITVLGGEDKDGNPEKIERLSVVNGEILAVAGPTGAGKTQLISDIGHASQEERLTGRTILINGQPAQAYPEKKKLRHIIAQVSQNMNFVMDMTVLSFLQMHAKIRGIDSCPSILEQVLSVTNELAGEKVSFATNLTKLSGGQSRALMVADVALVSNAPVVLIDEIENAGIDRLRALEILTEQKKIVLVVSHDPTLILMASKRITMKNGGMDNICHTSAGEKEMLGTMLTYEKRTALLRNRLRAGESDIRMEGL